MKIYQKGETPKNPGTFTKILNSKNYVDIKNILDPKKYVLFKPEKNESKVKNKTPSIYPYIIKIPKESFLTKMEVLIINPEALSGRKEPFSNLNKNFLNYLNKLDKAINEHSLGTLTDKDLIRIVSEGKDYSSFMTEWFDVQVGNWIEDSFSPWFFQKFNLSPNARYDMWSLNKNIKDIEYEINDLTLSKYDDYDQEIQGARAVKLMEIQGPRSRKDKVLIIEDVLGTEKQFAPWFITNYAEEGDYDYIKLSASEYKQKQNKNYK